MAKSKKEKKFARKERQDQLLKATQRVQEKLRQELLDAGDDEEDEEVQYILSEEEEEGDDVAETTPAEAPAASSEAAARPAKAAANEEDEDRVKLPSAPAATKPTKAAHANSRGRKHQRIPWEKLKVMVVERFGPDASKVVSEHDGNAEDALFTIQLKMQHGSVPVPRHWNKLRSFLSLQADREEAINVVPPAIHALGIQKARATKQKHLAPDQKAVVACFMTGTPLQHRDFNIPLSRHGEIFYEGKWIPKSQYEPGKLSQRLQQALGITNAAPPPWLYSMQTMRRLPPAYPAIRLPGLNAPIPPGAQWGRGQGQWGEPPRGEGNAFLFPTVMGESAGAAPDPFGGWGRVPALKLDTPDSAAAATAQPTPPPPSTQPAPQEQRPPAPAPRAVVTPTPFQPKAFIPHEAMNQGGNRYGPAVPQEYVRVQDGGVGSVVAVGHTYVQRGDAQQRRPPPPPPPPQSAARKHAPRANPAKTNKGPAPSNPPNKSGTTRF